MDGRTLKGIAVVAVSDGEKIGAIDQVRFDLNSRQLQALMVKSSGLIGGHTYYLPAENVQSIGADAVMILDRTALLPDSAADRFQQYPKLEDLTSLRVVTEGGTDAGKLASVDFDPANRAITGIAVEPPGITGVFRTNIQVPIDQIINIGRDVVVIPDSYGAGTQTCTT